MPRFSHIAFVLVCLLMMPVCAFAQDDAPQTVESDTAAADVLDAPKTMEDNFGGAQLGLYYLAGIGRCDDKMCNDSDVNKKDTILQMNVDLEFSYLWGHEVFVGPALHAHYRVSTYAGGDLRVKVVVPFDSNNAIATSIGCGWGWEMDQLIDDEVCGADGCHTDNTNYDLPHGMYIPFQFGYDHVFDFGFVLGVSFEAHLSFNRIQRMENEKTEVHPVLGLVSGGVHLGYQF